MALGNGAAQGNRSSQYLASNGDVQCKCSLHWGLCVGRVSRPLPCPSDVDRAGEFSFGRLESGGPASSRFSAIVEILSGWLLTVMILINF